MDGTDFAILAGNFGKTGMTYAQGDLNGDGKVNGTDFAMLAGNFGKTVPAPAAVVASAAVTALPFRRRHAAEPKPNRGGRRRHLCREHPGRGAGPKAEPALARGRTSFNSTVDASAGRQ